MTLTFLCFIEEMKRQVNRGGKSWNQTSVSTISFSSFHRCWDGEGNNSLSIPRWYHIVTGVVGTSFNVALWGELGPRGICTFFLWMVSSGKIKYWSRPFCGCSYCMAVSVQILVWRCHIPFKICIEFGKWIMSSTLYDFWNIVKGGISLTLSRHFLRNDDVVRSAENFKEVI